MISTLYQSVQSGFQRMSILQFPIILALISIDLSLKFELERSLEAWHESVPVFPGIKLTLSHNRGISFGVLESEHWLAPYLLSSFAIIIVVVGLGWAAKQRSRLINTAGIFFAAGGLANAIDRLGDGAVTDYLDIGWRSMRWPTFNLADIFIFIGVALFLIGVRANSTLLRSEK